MTEETKKIIEHKRNFLNLYEDSDDPEISEMVSCIKETDHFYMMNCNLSKRYDSLELDIKTDRLDKKYILWGGRRIYFPHIYLNKINWQFKALLREQDVYSPHRYLDDRCYEMIRQAKVDKKRIIVFELGAMEGMFSLELVDLADEIFLFECDNLWAESLKSTFDKKDNVHIINKSVSNISKENQTTVDEFNVDVSDALVIMKMDIEGNELLALQGAQQTIDTSSQFMGLICAYHRKNDEHEIRDLFEGYEIYSNRGYFCFFCG